MTGQAGDLTARSLREAHRLAAGLRRRARGRGAQDKLRAAERIERLTQRAAKVCEQITKRVAGQKITDRLVSMRDPDARPIRKGKLRQPTEFGTVMQVAELCENTRRGARGLIVPLATQIGSPNEPNLRPAPARASTGSAGGHARSPWTAASRPARSRTTSPNPNGSSSPAANPPAPGRPTAARPVPSRLRRPHQPPQTPLRNTPIPAQRPRRSPDHRSLGDPGLQPRHPRHPDRLTPSDRRRLPPEPPT